MDDAGLKKETLDPTRFGVVFGAGTIPGDLADLGPAAQESLDPPNHIDLKKWGERGMAQIPPMWMLNHVPNMPACHVSILQNAQGPNNSISQTDAGGLLALGEAFRALQVGRADLFLVGGADAKINPLAMARQCLFTPLSRRNDAPERASRPFDRGRDGVVLGEGGVVFVLEEWEHARRRGCSHLRRGAWLRRRLRSTSQRRRRGSRCPSRYGRSERRLRRPRSHQRSRL